MFIWNKLEPNTEYEISCFRTNHKKVLHIYLFLFSLRIVSTYPPRYTQLPNGNAYSYYASILLNSLCTFFWRWAWSNFCIQHTFWNLLHILSQKGTFSLEPLYSWMREIHYNDGVEVPYLLHHFLIFKPSGVTKIITENIVI